MDNRYSNSAYEPSFSSKGEVNIPRLLKKTLAIKVGNIDPAADMYVFNGYRLAGVAASVDDGTFNIASQKFLNHFKLGIDRISIRLGYETYFRVENAQELFRRLKEPHHRILGEIFWPHLDGELFDTIRRERSLISDAVIDKLAGISKSGGKEQQNLAVHSLAVAYHNLAISKEIEFLAGGQKPQTHLWSNALKYWGETLNSKEFWSYMRNRAGKYADHRFGPENVNDDFKNQIAALVLSFNALFIKCYARMGNNEMCNVHLNLISNSGFEYVAKKEVLGIIAKDVTMSRLEPLVQRARNPRNMEYFSDDNGPSGSSGTGCPKCGFSYRWDGRHCGHCGHTDSGARPAGKNAGTRSKARFPAAGKVSWRVFSDAFASFLDEAAGIRESLSRDFHLPEDIVNMAEFDSFIVTVLNSMDELIDFGNERERAILYILVNCSKMQRLPMSSAARQRILSAITSNRRSLYIEFKLPNDVDPAECWFLEGAYADPAESILMPVNRITHREAYSCQFQTFQIIIPRSKAAAKFHRGGYDDPDDTSGSGVPRSGGSPRGSGGISREELMRACRMKNYGDIPLQINAAKEQARQDRLKIEQEKESKISAIRADSQRNREAFDRKIAGQEKSDHEYIETVKKQVQEKQKAYQAQLADSQNKIEKEYEDKIKKADLDYANAKTKYASPASIIKIDLVLSAAGLLVLGCIGAIVSAFTTLDVHTPPVIFGFLGLIAGGFAGRRIRYTKLNPFLKPLKNLKSQLQQKLDTQKRNVEQQLRAIQQKANTLTAEHKARIQANTQQRETMKKRTDEAVAGAEKEAQRKIRDIEDATEKKIKQLERKISVKVKSEWEKTNFPAYRNAMSQGYNDGTKPPGYV
jgi:hypothetical protein